MTTNKKERERERDRDQKTTRKREVRNEHQCLQKVRVMMMVVVINRGPTIGHKMKTWKDPKGASRTRFRHRKEPNMRAKSLLKYAKRPK